MAAAVALRGRPVLASAPHKLQRGQLVHCWPLELPVRVLAGLLRATPALGAACRCQRACGTWLRAMLGPAAAAPWQHQSDHFRCFYAPCFALVALVCTGCALVR